MAKQPTEFKLPSAKEVFDARQTIMDEQQHKLRHKRIMRLWTGAGWHENELFYGILVGLQIAENRKRKESQSEESS